MGLDQYLSGAKKDRGILTNWEDVYSWRKANEIHGYFSRLHEERTGSELENCEQMLLYRADIETMVERLKEAVESFYLDGDDSKAREWFPCTPGFFFGSYNMGSWYWHDLEDTAEKLQSLLDEGDFEETKYEDDMPYMYFKYYGWW